MSTAYSPVPSDSRRRKVLRYVLTGLLVTLITSAIGTLIFGRVQGQEFSPTTFSVREFGYFQIPVLSVPITAVSRQPVSNTQWNFLLTGKHIRPTGPARWHLLWARSAGRRLDPRGASILTTYLNMIDANGQPYWANWTTEHPDRAKVLWPLVAELARRDLYAAIPDLMRFAEQEPSLPIEEFQQRTNELLAERVQHFAAILEQRGAKTRAAELRSWAISQPAS